ncbi:glyoxylase-like metal-dependent hydrolase (beta-lactamase superfamily II) [Bacillus tianshenii]|uniref:Glyoxylase-like metal-dependent hydrolase (Beta-lactamase superfamily II) n=1 Tax=Sutcliffiella tianshenii TaxID=1463404 RepID=A0ABS2NZR9_9BACI|nr:MBL fold metallo-hydrolase [Bacillus tianshenii]MBM7620215.1 glyoxylase-like metal-dependent hydrolase (beta-lactamase superfamily II) [Bacillus tianshenii]
MKWMQLPLGPLQTNAYLLINSKRECLVIDPGSEGEALIQYIEEKGWTPLAVLLTHAHFDHIGAVDSVRDHWKVPVYLHKKEKNWLMDPSLNGSQFFQLGAITAKPADILIQEEGNLIISDFTLEVLFTPGHSPGSVSFYHEESKVVFAGDALFAGSIGRTDLPGGDHNRLIKSIHDKLLVLPEETTVLSGHGMTTTIEREMDSNPFLNGF